MTAEAIALVCADLRAGRFKTTVTSSSMRHAALEHLKLARDAAEARALAPVVDCTDIYRSLGTVDKGYNVYDDFPCIAPPWPAALYCYVNEYGNVVVMFTVAAQREGSGDLLFADTADLLDQMSDDPGRPWKPATACDWSRVRWTLETFIWVGGRSSTLGPMPTHGPLVLWRWAIYEDGSPADLHWMQLSEQLPIEEWDLPLVVLMSAMNVLNCINVDIVDYQPTSRHERRRLDRTGVRMSTIHVFPAGTRRRAGDRGEPYGVAHHGVRGHYATYGSHGRGLLFGKYAGRFYRPAHQRGQRERGEVVQDYEVHPERPA